MFFSGPWHLGLIKDAGGADIEGKWAIAPMPKKVSATSFLGGSNLVVFKESENKDAAWAFVQYLSDPATQVDWYNEVTVLPSVQAAWDDPALKDDAERRHVRHPAPGHQGPARDRDLDRALVIASTRPSRS